MVYSVLMESVKKGKVRSEVQTPASTKSCTNTTKDMLIQRFLYIKAKKEIIKLQIDRCPKTGKKNRLHMAPCTP